MARRLATTYRQYKLLISSSVVVFALLVALVATSNVPADLTSGPNVQARDRFITSTILGLLDHQHLLRRPLDDEISQRTLQTFLKQLDPMKVYFYQEDIDEFRRSDKLLDDQIRDGNLSFAYMVFNRFLKRMDQRVALVPKLLEQTHNFAANEVITMDPDVAKYPTSAAEAEDRWRRRIKYDLLMEKARDKAKAKDKQQKDEDAAHAKAVERLNRRYRSYVRRMHQYKPDDVLEIYLSALTTSFDPHTSYMSPTTLKNFNISMKLELDGIGAALSLVDGYTVVSRVIQGGAADKQGELQPEDRIISVAQGYDGEEVDVIDMRLNDVVKLIRGKAGTVVRLGIIRETNNESKTIQIVRERIELKDSEATGEIFDGTNVEGGLKPNGQPYRIGFIKLPSFYMDMRGARLGLTDFKSTTRDVHRILIDFRRQGIDAVVLDLRFNGGGSLTEAINLTGLFIDTGPVVQVKDFDGRVQAYNDPDSDSVWDGPLVVLTNKFSASASEILAGAIQDYQRGIVIGDYATHGKGTVQSLLDLKERLFPGMSSAPNLGALKITMQQFYRPDGDSTQKRGVIADVPLPSTTNEMDFGEADLDYAVKFDTVAVAAHANYGKVTPDILAQLNSRSKARRDASEEFAKELRRIERYKEQKEREQVSLNEEEFFARRKELDADKEDENTLKKIDAGDEVIFDLENYYDKEVFQVTLDYLALLNQVPVAAVP